MNVLKRYEKCLIEPIFSQSVIRQKPNYSRKRLNIYRNAENEQLLHNSSSFASEI